MNHLLEALRPFPQFVIHNGDKVPRRAADFINCDVTDSRNWATYETAVAAIQGKNGYGLGFALSPNDPFTCIDLDVDKGQQQTPFQREIFDAFADTYSELSPSGRGCHIWCKGSVETLKRPEIEIYSRARYLTLTDNPINNLPLLDRQSLLERLTAHLNNGKSTSVLTALESQQETQTDAAIISQLLPQLWNCEATQTEHRSEDDLALMKDIARLSRSQQQTRRIFMMSPRANTPRSNKTGNDRDKCNKRPEYVDWTLKTAFADIDWNAVEMQRNGIQITNAAPTPQTKANKTSYVKGLVINSMTDTTPEIIDWIWYRYLPKKRLAILAGVGNAGKSTLTLNMAATVSNGGRWPDGSYSQQGKVLLWSGEDIWKEDVVPRLAAMGANPNNIFNIEAALDDKGVKVPFSPVRDVPRITETLKAYPGISLVIISPLVSLVKGDMNATNITRDGLQSLVDMAEQTDVCVLGITHFRKDSEGQIPMHRVMGSAAFTQLPRVAMGAVRSKDGNRRALAVIKGNNGTETIGALEYYIRGKEVTYNGVTIPEKDCSVIEWGGNIPGNAHDIFNDIEEVKDKYAAQLPKTDEAMQLLQTLLANGATLSKAEMFAEGAKAGITNAAISRAINQLQLECKKQGINGGWAL